MSGMKAYRRTGVCAVVAESSRDFYIFYTSCSLLMDHSFKIHGCFVDCDPATQKSYFIRGTRLAPNLSDLVWPGRFVLLGFPESLITHHLLSLSAFNIHLWSALLKVKPDDPASNVGFEGPTERDSEAK